MLNEESAQPKVKKKKKKDWYIISTMQELFLIV